MILTIVRTGHAANVGAFIAEFRTQCSFCPDPIGRGEPRFTWRYNRDTQPFTGCVSCAIKAGVISFEKPGTTYDKDGPM